MKDPTKEPQIPKHATFRQAYEAAKRKDRWAERISQESEEKTERNDSEETEFWDPIPPVLYSIWQSIDHTIPEAEAMQAQHLYRERLLSIARQNPPYDDPLPVGCMPVSDWKRELNGYLGEYYRFFLDAFKAQRGNDSRLIRDTVFLCGIREQIRREHQAQEQGFLNLACNQEELRGEKGKEKRKAYLGELDQAAAALCRGWEEKVQSRGINDDLEVKPDREPGRGKFNPADFGGKELRIVVSYTKAGKTNLRKLAFMLRDKAGIKYQDGRDPVEWYQENPKAFKSHLSRLRKKARDKGWWDRIPDDYWESYR